MRNHMKKAALSLAVIITLSSGSAFAADRDIVNVETKAKTEFEEWLLYNYEDVVLYGDGVYLIEFDEEYYKIEEVLVESNKNPGADLNELVKGLSPVMDPTVPSVKEQWDLDITVKNAKGEEITDLVGDGVATAIVSFELKNKETGEVDKNANDVVLFVSATRGKLSQERITIQNGKADMIIQSEFFSDVVDAKIDAQVIEASSDYAELIGEVVGSKTIQIVPKGYQDDQISVISIVGANTNEADRVTAIFDGEVKASDFYYTQKTEADKKGKRVGEIITDVVKVSQGDKDKEIVAVLLDSNNPKKATFVLNKEEVLTDNKDVKVTAKVGSRATAKSVNFKLTDARRPNLTSVKSKDTNNQLVLKFSEPIYKSQFVLNGRFGSDTFEADYGKVYFDKDKVRFVDERNLVTLTLNENYQETDKNSNNEYIYPAGYFKPGLHTVEASDIYDFAAKTDSNNIGTTQVLEFNIDELKGEVEVRREVDSPEQFRMLFDRPVSFKNEDGARSSFENEYKFEVYNEETSKWVNADENYFTESVVDASDLIEVTSQIDDQDGNQIYKLELKHDWTKVYDTEETKNNFYNDKFRVVLPKGTVVSSSTGKANTEDIIKDMTKGTALSRPDIVSPKISSMKATKTAGQFEVTMTEPVKLSSKKDTSGSATLAQGQTQLPVTLVEFLGKDKNGKTVTFIGKLDGYAETYTDKAINVSWTANEKGETPQTIVNDGGSTDWTLVVKAISDDVGNVTATDSADFTLKGVETVGKFMVNPKGGNAIGDDGITNTFAVKGTIKDEVEVTFTEDVSTSGLGSATNVSNYTLNGAKLPTGSSIRITSNDDNKTVTISLPLGTLDAKSNVLILGEQLISAKGRTLVGDVSFTFNASGEEGEDTPPGDQIDKTALTAAIAEVEYVVVSEDGSEVETTEVWTTEDAKTTLEAAVAAAQAVVDNTEATQGDVDAAAKTLTDAVQEYEDAKQFGLKEVEKEGSLKAEDFKITKIDGGHLVSIDKAKISEDIELVSVTIGSYVEENSEENSFGEMVFKLMTNSEDAPVVKYTEAGNTYSLVITK